MSTNKAPKGHPDSRAAGGNPLHKQWVGLDRTFPVCHITYDKVFEIVISMEGQAKYLRPDMIVGVMRGGVVPATMLAQRLSIDLAFVKYHRGAAAPEWQTGAPPKGRRILLVDDIVSTGKTITTVQQYLAGLGNEVHTLTMFYDPARSDYRPDVSLEADKYIMFPWETKDTTPRSRALFEQRGYILPSEEEDFFAVDLDGVIVPDIRKVHYRKRLDITLSMRQHLELLPHRPKMANMVIITGRPACDFDVTRAMLDQNGYEGIDLICRDPGAYTHATEDVAAYKAAKASEVGATVFIESELTQALIIAERCPTMTVIWWGKKRRLRIGGVNEFRLPSPPLGAPGAGSSATTAPAEAMA